MKYSFPAVAVASLLLGAPVAHASIWSTIAGWFSASPSGTAHTAAIRVLYTVDPSEDTLTPGTFPAFGVRVAVYTQSTVTGASIQDAAETDATGTVTLHYQVSSSQSVKIRVVTDGSRAKTFPGAWNPFLSPHQADVTFANGSSQSDITSDVSFSGEINHALAVQSAGTHARTFGEARLAAAIPGASFKVDYSYPGLAQFGTTYTPFKDRVIVADNAWMRCQSTIFHETGHTFWYTARGGPEYYWPLSHSMTEDARNPHLAMSEGLADWYAVLVKDAFGSLQGRPDIANHEYAWVGEQHMGRNDPSVPFASWGDDNETNVACSLYDLVDTGGQDQGLLPGAIGPSPFGSSDAGLEAVFSAVVARSQRGGGQIALTDFWVSDLAALFPSGASALGLNSVPLR